jgi:hypothetical protein
MLNTPSELEPDAPDWSKEKRSDDLLAAALKARLAKPFYKRQIRDWRERHSIKKMLKRLQELGFGN